MDLDNKKKWDSNLPQFGWNDESRLICHKKWNSLIRTQGFQGRIKEKHSHWQAKKNFIDKKMSLYVS